MKRLTMHTPDGACLIINADNEQDARQELKEKFKEACNKLAELEDKFENGTLIELPCKVGDTVYYIYPIMHSIREDRCFVKQIIVNEISLDINGIRIFDELGIDHDLERIYFTKEEAEKAFERLNNDGL